MELTEEQKNCPYCHMAEKTAPYTAIGRDGNTYEAVGFYSANGEDIARAESKNAQFVLNGREFAYKIKYQGEGKFRFRYCPMCGRSLNDEKRR